MSLSNVIFFQIDDWPDAYWVLPFINLFFTPLVADIFLFKIDRFPNYIFEENLVVIREN